MRDIVFIRELTDEDQVNDYLKNGWKLLNVLNKTIDGEHWITYVLGLDQAGYDKYKKELENDDFAKFLASRDS
ncbi:hypothetical protein [Parageobacillus toebii]|jgi:hypothetical protein|uniref:hypothetical protein n=1 Tax=Parageobacillus toebii TaxID=153151 RepID=UPI001967E0C5|nr:hypothetical protein [Parageobacillus toebii]QSB48800.1 hypothetical protein JTI59_17340 [Parageobacillus toebii]